MNGLLFDQNLPARLTFRPTLPIIPVTTLGANPNDSIIWDHARKNELVIVTKDADFSDRIILQNPPPWVVHLRFGNLCKKDYHTLLAKLWPQIESLPPKHKLINVYVDRMESIA